MSQLIISVSGLRGIVGPDLNPLVAIRYVSAFAAGLPPGPIVLTRDGRGTGRMLADAVRAGLTALGREVLDADVAATPTTGVLVRQYETAGGIQVSASHNPPEYNGLKLFSRDGCVIDAAAGNAVLARYQAGHIPWVTHETVGSSRLLGDTTSRHLALVLATVDAARIQACRFRVLLDANHGAGSVLGPQLLEALGCRVVLLGEVPDGRLDHPAEPTEAHLQSVLPQVPAHGAAVGFCQDPDADRLAVIDADGRYLGEEYTLALCLDHVLRQQRGPVVTNCATSSMARELAARYAVPFFLSPVGEAHVTGAMRHEGAVFGGEGNGGPIDPRVGYVRDSFVGMALILDAMAARQQTVRQLADELPRYAIHKTQFPLDDVHRAAVLAALERRFPDATLSRLDGLRWDWPGRWLLVRASNTEPAMRAIAEAATREEAQRLCAAVEEVVQAERLG